MKSSNPFINAEIAANYESWYHTDGLIAAEQEKELMQWLLRWFPHARSILEVGCGTGYFSRWFESLGLRVTGVDLAIKMLREAKNKDEIDYLLGDAMQIPVASKSFDLAVFITTLEFIQDTAPALKEALRIARQGIILGVINKHSSLGKRYKRSSGPIWGAAHLYSVAELRKLLLCISGENTKIVYRTALWPFWRGSLPLPWGGFIGMGALWLPEGEE